MDEELFRCEKGRSAQSDPSALLVIEEAAGQYRIRVARENPENKKEEISKSQKLGSEHILIGVFP
jgi:uncharacterized protein (DUF2344 family)